MTETGGTLPGEPSPTRWTELAGQAPGPDYAARFARLAATGQDMHGEASFCAGLVRMPARVLDAGCGTGRVAIRLAELGYRVVGVDVDSSMLAEARRAAPDLRWLSADLAALPGPDRLLEPADLEPADLEPASRESATAEAGFDLVVAAGNVIPLLAPGTLSETVRRLAAVLGPGGLLVAGFGLDSAHLPAGCPVTPAADYLAACAGAGLAEVARHGGWDGAAESDGYLVSVHSKPVS
ncbi:MAG TPA: class I SAM-dependent methyltransferase [Jatrophihabitans sp.]|jgi:SAM-dependent methyltransferase|uniref:class I SAM-dependent methyltransferase n=1 Tax=Jatrophihabitans sp. TaxID=1932789 RepID=UPI002F0E1833